MLLVAAVGLLAKHRLHGIGRHVRLTSASWSKQAQPALTVWRVLLGVIVTLTSIGAGALGVVARFPMSQ